MTTLAEAAEESRKGLCAGLTEVTPAPKRERED